MSRWTEDATIKFVREYLGHECLWNFNNKNYRNKLAKQRAFSEIAYKMGIKNFDGKDVYLKIKSLRSTYCQELKKIKDSKKSGASPDEIYQPHLKWFKLLNNALKSANMNGRKAAQDKTKDDIDNEHNDETPEQTNLKVEPQKKSRRRRITPIDINNDSLKIGNVPRRREAIEFDFFGQSVASQLKTIPLILALQAQQHIQNYLCELRIQHLRNSNQCCTFDQPTCYDKPSPSPTYYEDYRTPSPSCDKTTDNPIETNCEATSQSSEISDIQTSSFLFVKAECSPHSSM